MRVLLDQTFVGTSDTRNNLMTVDALNALAQERGLDLEARLMSDYHELGVMHNKGVIADDSVLVSSINWADASVFQNREVGLIVSSPSVSRYFADFFWRDWAVDPDPPIHLAPVEQSDHGRRPTGGPGCHQVRRQCWHILLPVDRPP